MTKRFSRREFLGASAAAGAVAISPFRPEPADGATEKVGLTETSTSPIKRPILNTQDLVERYEEISLIPARKMTIDPHWFADSSKFWYRNDLDSGRKEFVLVDAESGIRQAAFDHSKLALSLSAASNKHISSDRLPFNLIQFVEPEPSIRFDIDRVPFVANLSTYDVKRLPQGTELLSEASERRDPPGDNRVTSWPSDNPQASPDGKWTASIFNYNVRITDSSSSHVDLTTDGTVEHPYGSMLWSPNSSFLVGYKTTPVEIKKVYMIESSPKEWSSRGILHEHEYAQAGDAFSSYEMWLFSPTARTSYPGQVDLIDFNDAPEVAWNADGTHFTYEYMDRGYQRFRIISVDASSGKSINIVDDKFATFVDSTNIYTWYSDDSSEVIYASERDGWRHLYLFDGQTGVLKSQITRGNWVVRSVDRVDQLGRQIWFTASGRNQGEDPYHLHKYRVNFDGSALIEVTDGDGVHTVTYSPNYKYVVDSYSKADEPPIHNLRLASDGSLKCHLERADITGLVQAGWKKPEVFCAKGRDGSTDIWGIVFRPLNHRADKKYPVIENIYAGPQDSFVRKPFAVADSMQALAELGFIVVQIDGMGTRNRSKEFHDVCWHNLKDAGFPDRIAWLKQLSAEDPSVDISRVGIYGTSAGGQNSTGGLLFHPEFYKVGVSSCGCHDNRIDKQWWNEQWMGYPVGPWYDESSNITNAHRLRGKLLLIVGELDTNVPPESTIRLTDSLMKAGKDFELIIITGSDHTDGGEYGERRRRDFFIRHLLDMEPPDRNVPVPPKTPVVLVPLPPTDAENASETSGSATTIEFINQTNSEMTLYWVSGSSRKSYATVEPGGNYTQNTYVGHTWLVVDASGKPIAAFIGTFRPGIAKIHD